MGVINEVLKGEKPDFGKIDIQMNFSFFEVEPGYGSSIINSVKGIQFEGRDVSIENAKKDTKQRNRPNRRRSDRKRGNHKKR